MKAWKVILAAVLLFAAGNVTGFAFSRFRARAAWREQMAKRAPLPAIAWQRFEFLRRAQRDLKLTDEQKSRVDALVKQSQERVHKLWEPIAPEARAEFEALREGIRRELTAEQQPRFDELLKKSEKERRRLRDGTNAPTGDKMPRGEKR